MNITDLPDRLASKIEPEPMSGCWLWTASEDGKGYGQTTNLDGRHQLAYSVVYELLVGPVPYGLELDHLCRNRACVSPWHLEPVTHWENVRRGESGKHQADKTHCPQGHPYDEENSYNGTQKGSAKRRKCRACSREYFHRRGKFLRAARKQARR